MLLSLPGFGALCRASVPGGAPTASDSVILLLTIQLFSLLPHYQRTDTRERERGGGWGGGVGAEDREVPQLTVHPPR